MPKIYLNSIKFVQQTQAHYCKKKVNYLHRESLREHLPQIQTRPEAVVHTKDKNCTFRGRQHEVGIDPVAMVHSELQTKTVCLQLKLDYTVVRTFEPLSSGDARVELYVTATKNEERFLNYSKIFLV